MAEVTSSRPIVDSDAQAAEARALGGPASDPSEARETPGWLTRVIDGICTVALGVVVIAMLGELGILFGNLIVRAVSGHDWAWSQEVAQLALSIIAFIGGAVAYRRGRQPALTYLADRLPARWQPVRPAAVDITVFALPIGLFAVSWPAVQAAGAVHSDFLKIPMSWFAVSVPIGALLFSLFALDKLLKHGVRILLTGLGVVAALLLVEYGIWQLVAYTYNTAAIGTAAAIVVFAALLLLGVPIALVLLAASGIYIVVSSNAPLSVTTTNLTGVTNNFLLVSIPFFVLAGFIMSNTKLSQGLAGFAESIFGRVHGGSLHVVVFMMYVFSGLSGSKSADIAAVGGVLEEPLRKRGYSSGEITGVVAASAIMGETIPPCVTLLILGSVTSISISQLFLGGIVPAAVLAVLLMAGIYVNARRQGRTPPKGASAAEVGRSFIGALPSLAVPVVLVGGIVGGFASPTEISSVAVVAGLILAICYRTKLRDFKMIIEGSAITAGMVLFLTSCAQTLSWAISNAELPNHLLNLVSNFKGSPWLFILLTLVLVPVMGLALEGISAILIFAPVLVPIAESLGINIVQYGLVLVIAMALGAFAPPIGWLLYETCMICHTPPEQSFRPLLRHYAILVPGLILIAFVPPISTLLPHLVLHSPL
jgi:tripartite ATP-independent transporter DctM subunit